jgi:hypothetical protein
MAGIGFKGSHIARINIVNTPLHQRTLAPTTDRDTTLYGVAYQSGAVIQKLELELSGETAPYQIINNSIAVAYPTNTKYKQSVIQNKITEFNSTIEQIPATNSTRYDFSPIGSNPIYGARYDVAGVKNVGFVFHKPQNVYRLVLGSPTSNYQTLSASQTEYLEEITDFRKFNNLVELTVAGGGSFIKGLGVLPQKLESFQLRNLSNLNTSPTLPNTLKYIFLDRLNTSLSSTGLTSNINNLTNLKKLILGTDSGYPTTILTLGTNPNGELLDLSNKPELEDFVCHLNNSEPDGFDIQFPLQPLNVVSILNNPALNVDQAPYLRSLLTSGNTSLRMMSLMSCSNFNPTWNITSDDVKDNAITQFILSNTPITGTIDFSTDDCPTITQFYTSREADGASVVANFNTIKLDGLINTIFIQSHGNTNLTGFTLPIQSTPLLSTLRFYNNQNFSTLSNPTFKSILTGHTSLSTLTIDRLGYLDSNLDLSRLINLSGTISIYASKLSGTLTLPTGRTANGITRLDIYSNTGLTNVLNTSVMNLLTDLRAYDTQINIDFKPLTKIKTIQLYNTKQSIIDLSANDDGVNFFSDMLLYDNVELREIIWTTGVTVGRFGPSGDLNAYNCPILSGFTNIENVGWANQVAGTNIFHVYNTNLNITFPFGINQFYPRQINISNNGMSLANVDATIDSIYQNRDVWSGYTAIRTLNIAGTNAAPSGSYVAPSGYIQADAVTVGNDGTPANALEQVYVLVNQNIDLSTTKKYNWTITTT